MRWFRRGQGRQPVEHDPAHRQQLLHDVRQGFGPAVQVRFPDQAAEVQRLLTGDDGLAVAVEIIREFSDAAHADMRNQAAELYRRTGNGYAVDRRNYRQLWKAAGPSLRWPLFALPGALHPYIQVSAAVAAVGAQAKRCVRVTDPLPPLNGMLEILDLTIAGWEFARVRVDTDAATLANRVITSTRALHDAMDEPPPLPPPVRELMRTNRTLEVYDTIANRVAAQFNPGRTMREVLLT
jgi:hypothetical protein